MPTVTVPGANHSTVSLVYDRDANALLALQVAGIIRAGIDAGSIRAADNASGPPPALPPGVTGEFVQSKSGTTLLPTKYDYVVDSAKNAVIFGNGDPNEQVLVGAGNLSFYATGGAGSVIGGGGNDQISLAPSAGSWLIALGDGDDTIRALGSGNDTISTGKGNNSVQLGSGGTFFTTTGSNTIQASSGTETIQASAKNATEEVFGASSKLFFVTTSSATVFGGTGSDTVFGTQGPDLFEGGSGGNNFLQAGNGRATLFGGGDGDQLYAGGSEAQWLRAGSGNETLSGAFASGKDTFTGGSGSDQITGGSGKNTFVAGTGAATITASPGAMNLFDFMKSMGGGTELVTGLTSASQVHIDLSGYSSTEVKYALAHQITKDGSTTVTLSDNTMVTFQNVGKLSSGNFSDNAFGGGPGDDHHHDDDHGGHGHHGR